MSPLDRALEDLRHAVHNYERTQPGPTKDYLADRVNEAAYAVNVEIHNEFPNHHKHPGPYRPLIRGEA